MGCNMCTPNNTNVDNTEKEKLIRVKELEEGRYKVRFIKNTITKEDNVPQPSYFDCGFRKTSAMSNNGLENSNETTAYSTKDETTKDMKSSPGRMRSTKASRASMSAGKSKVWDDWEILEEQYADIKKIGIYTSYYVKAIKIIYQTDDLKTFESLHASPGFDSDEDPNLTYQEMELEDGEHVEKINVVKSVQTGYVRSITLGTNCDRNLCIEGEIEVHDLLQMEVENRIKLGDKELSENCDNTNSFYYNDQEWNGPVSSKLASTCKHRLGKKSILLEDDDEIYDMDKLEVRKQSVYEPETKNHYWNLKCINHILIGLKTSFSKNYLESIELYTELNEGVKFSVADNSPGKSNFLFE